MNLHDLQHFLTRNKVGIKVNNGELLLRAEQGVLNVNVISALKEHKAELLKLYQDCDKEIKQTLKITPEMLPLVDINQDEIDAITARVPNGVANIQDIYPLSPMQEGIFFHSLMSDAGDIYIQRSLFSFVDRQSLDGFIKGLQNVISRHDILRTAVFWDNLSKPLQVVFRQAKFESVELEKKPKQMAEAQLLEVTDPGRYRFDFSHAPLMKLYFIYDDSTDNYLVALLNHHIIGDHLTLGYIIHEIQLILTGQEDAPAPALPYRNFIARLEAAGKIEFENYFRQQLGDISETTALFGITENSDGRHALHEARRLLKPDLMKKIRSTAKQQNTTAAVLFHAAWALVLSKCCGLKDIVMGTVLSGRSRISEQEAQVMGMFINTLPLRLTLNRQNVAEFVADVQKKMLQLLEYEQAPLAEVQRCSGVVAPQPLFTSLINYRYRDYDDNIFNMQGMQLLSIDEYTNYPFGISIDDSGKAFELHLQCVSDIDPNRIIEYLILAIERICDALAESPSIAIAALSVLPESEYKRVINEFGQSESIPITMELIHQLFEKQVDKCPNNPALAYEGKILTYEQLNRRANRLAHLLRQRGVCIGDRVALCLDRGFDAVTALLAIMKSGAVYVPLDIHYPVERLRHMLYDSDPLVLISQLELSDALAAVTDNMAGLSVLFCDGKDELKQLSRQSDQNPDPQEIGIGAHDLAYIIYTSGSSGQAKGVMVEHRNIVSSTIARINADVQYERCLKINSMAFDGSLAEILGTLSSGGCLYLINRDEAKNPEKIADAIKRYRITTVLSIPSLIMLIAEFLKNARHSLTHITVAGEVCPPSLKHSIDELGESIELVNEYGPTEATVWCTHYHYQQESIHSVPIGRPIANARIYILDDDKQPLPIGACGEIYIGGDGVSRGYRKQKQLTDEHFIQDPFSDNPADRVYKSGDLARWREDGYIEYMGRKDSQVKIRGYRIELGEIENCLQRHHAIKAAAVIARQDDNGNQRLLAYIVASNEVDIEQLQQYLSKQLPDYMVPVAYIKLDQLPRTTNGKLDIKALPEPDQASVLTQEYVQPIGKLEILIADLYQSLLGVQRVGRFDHFFELGGHSLLAVQLISRVRLHLGVEVSLQDLFAHPRLLDFARIIDGASSGEQICISVADRSVPLPLSWAQQRLWFLQQLDASASAAYHIPAALRLEGNLDCAALRAALNRIVARHEILRTVFVPSDKSDRGSGNEHVCQYIQDEHCGFSLCEKDLSELNASEQESHLLKVIEDEIGAGFDLCKGPLIRGNLLKLAHHTHVLLITQHHIISDGWSISILMDEFKRLYHAYCQKLPDPLPKLSLQYADYAVWQRSWLQGDRLQTQIDYWCAKLKDAPALLELPTDYPRQAKQSYRGGQISFTIDACLLQRLYDFAKKHDATLFMLLLSGWFILLFRLSGRDDIVIGTPVANRQHQELEPLIGFFVNTLALRIKTGDKATVIEVLQAVKACAREAYAYQDIPFEQVVEAIQPLRSLSFSPIFQVLFTLNNTPHQNEMALTGLELTPLEFPHTTTQFDLSLTLNESKRGLQAYLEYAEDLFDRPTIERFSGYYQKILLSMIEDEAQSIADISLLDASQRSRLLNAFGANNTDYGEDRLLQALFSKKENNINKPIDPLCLDYASLFAKQLDRNPNKIVAISGNETITYHALDIRSNRLAQALLEAGVQNEQIVVLIDKRGINLLSMMIAVLKSGAAFLSLDVNQPVERLSSMVAESQSCLCLYSESYCSIFATINADSEHMVQGLVVEQAVLNNHRDEFVGKARPDSLAYVIYTSGSTGTPKGALIEQRGMLNNILGKVPTIGLCQQDVIAQTASPAFDISVWQFLAAPLLGATVHIVPDKVMHNPKALLQEIEHHRISILEIVPSLIRSVLEVCSDCIQLDSLRWLLPTGEALPLKLCQDWFRRFPGIPLMNLYGPAECSDDVAYYVMTQQPEDNSVIPIGRPTPNSQLYILDKHLQPLPEGVVGEICIGGVGVGRGYLNNQAATDTSFIENPFFPGQRLYRSGDLGRLLADGNIEFCGRNDFQIKLRGFRIEPGEVESKLMQCNGVSAALVDVSVDHKSDKRLVAYLLAEKSHVLNKGDLRAQLLQVLPDYMVPSAFIVMEQFPLNANGKIDRKALPQPEASDLLVREYRHAETEIETCLSEIWRKLLNVERVGRDDHFFELGGHSLLIITLIERLQQQGYELDVQSVFTAPSLAEMAQCIERNLNRSTALTIADNLIPKNCRAIKPQHLPLLDLTQVEIDRIIENVPQGVANVQDIYPLAPLQEGILFHYLMQNEGDPYLLRLELGFDNRKCVDRFLSALQQVIDRHDILRSGIQWEGLTKPVQVVQRRAPLSIETLCLDPNSDFTQQFFQQTDPATQRLDLRSAPLLKAFIARENASNHWRLALLNHHMVCDHLTQNQIIYEIKLILQGLHEQLPAVFPFRNFIAQLGSVSLSEQEAYFTQQLGHINEPSAPFALLDVQADIGNMIKANLVLDQQRSKAIRNQARLAGTSAAVLFHIAWAQVLSQCCGQQEVVMGSVLLGRSSGLAGSDQALGMFMNTLPLCVALQDRCAAELVQAVHYDFSRLLLHEQASLSMAQRCSGVEADTPLFTSLLNYRHNPDKGLLSDEDLKMMGLQIIGGEEKTNYPITVDIDDNESHFGMTLQCVKPLPVQRMLSYLDAALQKLITALENNSQTPLSAFSVIPDQELDTIIYGFNQTEQHFPNAGFLHQLFEKQVCRSAQQIAVSFAEQELSYHDLNVQANRLAHYLLSLQVKPDDRIAICCERSLEMLIAVLGVLKSGCAYVPLDPSYPLDRLQYMIKDCGAKALLLQDKMVSELFVDTSDFQPNLPILCLDKQSDLQRLSSYSDQNPDANALGLSGHNLAYMIYTSGSTGQPKGVGVKHAGLCNLLNWYQSEFAFSDQDNFLLITSFSFDLTQKNFFAPLLSGGRLYLSADAFDPALIVATIRDKAISRINLTPSAFYPLIEAQQDGDFKSLRSVFLGGETINIEQLLGLRTAYPNLELINTYGPTECTDVSTYFRLPHDWQSCREMLLPIGRPIANTQHYILDTLQRPVPIGVSGELYIAGAGVSRGYLNQPDLTAESFVANPFVNKEGSYLYKTGDLVRYRDDGCIEYLGRNDFQVKVRGFRIELGEIETHLNACNGVRDCAVMVKENQYGAKVIAAYLLTEHNEPVSVEVLHQHLGHYLPEYMIPNVFMHLPEFPLTPSGKLDRQALPEIDQSLLISRDYQEPESEIEIRLAEIWAELFALQKVGRLDHFFELGGHSLLAIQLASRVREGFHIDLPLSDLFEAPLLCELAEKIKSRQMEFFIGEEIDEIQAELESLSEDELAGILGEGETNES